MIQWNTGRYIWYTKTLFTSSKLLSVECEVLKFEKSLRDVVNGLQIPLKNAMLTLLMYLNMNRVRSFNKQKMRCTLLLRCKFSMISILAHYQKTGNDFFHHHEFRSTKKSESKKIDQKFPHKKYIKLE